MLSGRSSHRSIACGSPAKPWRRSPARACAVAPARRRGRSSSRARVPLAEAARTRTPARAHVTLVREHHRSQLASRGWTAPSGTKRSSKCTSTADRAAKSAIRARSSPRAEPTTGPARIRVSCVCAPGRESLQSVEDHADPLALVERAEDDNSATSRVDDRLPRSEPRPTAGSSASGKSHRLDTTRPAGDIRHGERIEREHRRRCGLRNAARRTSCLPRPFIRSRVVSDGPLSLP